jgi:hypothetical protein
LTRRENGRKSVPGAVMLSHSIFKLETEPGTMVGVRLHLSREFLKLLTSSGADRVSAPPVVPVLPKLNTRGTDDICSRRDRGHDAGRDHARDSRRGGRGGRGGRGDHACRGDSCSDLYSLSSHICCGGATRTHLPDGVSCRRYM